MNYVIWLGGYGDELRHATKSLDTVITQHDEILYTDELGPVHEAEPTTRKTPSLGIHVECKSTGSERMNTVSNQNSVVISVLLKRLFHDISIPKDDDEHHGKHDEHDERDEQNDESSPHKPAFARTQLVSVALSFLSLFLLVDGEHAHALTNAVDVRHDLAPRPQHRLRDRRRDGGGGARRRRGQRGDELPATCRSDGIGGGGMGGGKQDESVATRALLAATRSRCGAGIMASSSNKGGVRVVTHRAGSRGPRQT